MIDSFGPEQGQVAGFCEHVNERPVAIKCWDILDRLNNFSFSKRTLHRGVY
jgi:hypothetical protein